MDQMISTDLVLSLILDNSHETNLTYSKFPQTFKGLSDWFPDLIERDQTLTW